MLGGMGAPNAELPATPEIQALIEKVKHELFCCKGGCPTHYEAISYVSQTVAGTNYAVKIKIGCCEYMHVTIHEPLYSNPDQNLRISKKEDNKSQYDKLEIY